MKVLKFLGIQPNPNIENISRSFRVKYRSRSILELTNNSFNTRAHEEHCIFCNLNMFRFFHCWFSSNSTILLSHWLNRSLFFDNSHVEWIISGKSANAHTRSGPDIIFFLGMIMVLFLFNFFIIIFNDPVFERSAIWFFHFRRLKNNECLFPCFQHLVWVRPTAEADCVISIAYGPEKDNNGKSYTARGWISPFQDFPFFKYFSGYFRTL